MYSVWKHSKMPGSDTELCESDIGPFVTFGGAVKHMVNLCEAALKAGPMDPKQFIHTLDVSFTDSSGGMHRVCEVDVAGMRVATHVPLDVKA